MTWLIKILCGLLILSHLMLESGALLQIMNGYQRMYLHPFKSPWYEYPYKEGISIYHWIQMNAVEFNICTLCFVFAKAAKQYSYRLFLVAIIFFAYHVIDWAMMWWDYKTSVIFYWFLNAAILLALISLFAPEKKQGIVKSIN